MSFGGFTFIDKCGKVLTSADGRTRSNQINFSTLFDRPAPAFAGPEPPRPGQQKARHGGGLGKIAQPRAALICGRRCA
jgi:hypothetical protein